MAFRNLIRWSILVTVALAQTTLSPYVTPAPMPQGAPWGNSYAQRGWQDTPNTGVRRAYDFTISRSTISPDGVVKPAILINGQYPGPLIEANWGDTVQVTVHNNISGPSEGTALHWHGLYQHGTQWADGIPAIDQCPIAPGKSFQYTWKADQYGTSWWHSHYDAQFTDGAYGPMVIHGPKTTPYDIDLGVVMLQAHYQKDYTFYVQETSGIPFAPPFNDGNLINGKNPIQYVCPSGAPYSCTDYTKMTTFNFTPGKMHRLRLVNTGGDGVQRFAIDGHNMTVIANDFTPVQPYQTNMVTLGVGQRTDILVYGSGAPSSSWFMRSDLTAGSCGISQQIHALAGIYYPQANKAAPPNSTASPVLSDYTVDFCRNQALSLTTPLFSKAPPTAPAYTQQLDIVLGANSSGNALFFVNDVSFRGNYNYPIFLLSKLGNTSYPQDPQWNVYNFYDNSSIRMIVNNTTPLSHPIHLHGHTFWVIAEGVGTWNGTVTANPQRRDVQLVQSADPNTGESGYLVLEWEQDNPGTWPFHCHIAWHISTGLYISIIEQPDQIRKANIPFTVAQTCRDWWTYTQHNFVDQIDSGL